MAKLTLTLILFFLFNNWKCFCFEVDEDAFLSFTQLATKYGYTAEKHFVTTHDGYILRLHRILCRKNVTPKNQVVFIMHGLLLSSLDWITSGPNRGLGYVLADEGYDVWIGNDRGNHESRNHTTLNPDTDTQFWEFSFHEIGVIDIPTMIDYILEETNQQQLYHIGHSQATTTFYVMTSMRPEYNKKVRAHFSLTPVAFLKHMRKGVLWAAYQKPVTSLFKLLGQYEVLPQSNITRDIAAVLCHDGSPLQFLCSDFLYLVFGYSPKEMITTFLPLLYTHFPAGASVYQLQHYAQLMSTGNFSQYDYGTKINLKKYGTVKPPLYNLENIKTPIYLFYSRNDPYTNEIDITHLCDSLGPTCKAKILNEDHQFNHLDVMFGKHVVELVYKKVINILKTV